jgi:hypothetical protein
LVCRQIFSSAFVLQNSGSARSRARGMIFFWQTFLFAAMHCMQFSLRSRARISQILRQAYLACQMIGRFHYTLA